MLNIKIIKYIDPVPLAQALAETRLLNQVALHPTSEFWPLTAITPASTTWAAFQVHHDVGSSTITTSVLQGSGLQGSNHTFEGYVHFFRRENATSDTFMAPWVGLAHTGAAGAATGTVQVMLEYRYVLLKDV